MPFEQYKRFFFQTRFHRKHPYCLGWSDEKKKCYTRVARTHEALPATVE